VLVRAFLLAAPGIHITFGFLGKESRDSTVLGEERACRLHGGYDVKGPTSSQFSSRGCANVQVAGPLEGAREALARGGLELDPELVVSEHVRRGGTLPRTKVLPLVVPAAFRLRHCQGVVKGFPLRT
jgi:hypothetical protein